MAGLIDPDCSTEEIGASRAEEYRAAGVEFCLMLATHFNRRSLQVITLWTRIGSAIATAAAKVQDGDIASFANLCLDHVKAHIGVFVADEKAATLIADTSAKPAEWRQGFIRYMASRSYAVLIFGRQAWEEVKAEREARRNQLAAQIEAAEMVVERE